MKIVVLDGWTLNPGDLSWDALRNLGPVEIYDRTLPSEIIARAKEAEIILTNKVCLNSEILSALPCLKYIGVLATGFNIVNVEAAAQRRIPVCNVPGYSAPSVSQLVFALLLEWTHGVQRHSESVHQGEWSRCPDFSFTQKPLMELAGKTFGILGFGEIGRSVATIAQSFGMNVIAHRRTPIQDPKIQSVSRQEIFAQSDVLSLHCPLTPETQQIINAESLKKMKRTSFLINTGRGGLIDEKALAQALGEGWIAGAGLDVLSQEPPPADHPLLKQPNCWITPHYAWATREARERLMAQTVANIQAFLNGKPVHQVNCFLAD